MKRKGCNQLVTHLFSVLHFQVSPTTYEDSIKSMKASVCASVKSIINNRTEKALAKNQIEDRINPPLKCTPKVVFAVNFRTIEKAGTQLQW